jgi:hypothetical protein
MSTNSYFGRGIIPPLSGKKIAVILNCRNKKKEMWFCVVVIIRCIITAKKQENFPAGSLFTRVLPYYNGRTAIMALRIAMIMLMNKFQSNISLTSFEVIVECASH